MSMEPDFERKKGRGGPKTNSAQYGGEKAEVDNHVAG